MNIRQSQTDNSLARTNFVQELQTNVKPYKIDILKTKMAPIFNFFDFLTKKECLLIYLRHFRRISLFKEKNEQNLFVGLKLAELVNKHYAFCGINDAALNMPPELQEFHITSFDVPCFIVFRIVDDQAIVINKISLAKVDTSAKEQQVYAELAKIVEKPKVQNDFKSPDRIKPTGFSEKSKIIFKKNPNDDPIGSKVSHQKESSLKSNIIKSKNLNLSGAPVSKVIAKYQVNETEEEFDIEKDDSPKKVDKKPKIEYRKNPPQHENSNLRHEREFVKKTNNEPRLGLLDDTRKHRKGKTRKRKKRTRNTKIEK